MGTPLPEARWWERRADGRIQCGLCPRGCRLAEGETGFCRVRRHEGGRLVSLSHGRPTGFAVDPIEKKPLYHFLPGSQILSFGTLGCTLGCAFCQNSAHSHPEEVPTGGLPIPAERVVALAQREGVPAIAYTYNEPTVFAEYLVEAAEQARAAGLRNVIVTNGYVAPGARAEIYRHLDAANVDLKGFSDDFYRDRAAGRLGPVLDTLAWIRAETEVWLEVTTLLIPGLNDSTAMLAEECDWIHEQLGADTPVHFTAFHPAYQMLDRPPTPPETLARAREIARRRGLRHVYLGNVVDPEGARTVCPTCGAVLISRTGHTARLAGLTGAACAKCGTRLAGVFPEPGAPPTA